MKKFWKWTTVTDEQSGTDRRELLIDGPIAEDSWYGDEVTPKLFKKELNMGSGDITVRINSPGGDCVAASQIYTMLLEHKGNVTVKIDGIAASAASVIAMAGTNVLMAPTAMMMIHNPSTVAFGDHNAMQAAIDILNGFKDACINAYELKTGLDRNTLSSMLEDETWMDATRAVELGFADGMIEGGDTPRASGKSMQFGSAAVARNVSNKLMADIGNQSSGRKVSDLLEQLEKMK